jgi:hypothetical protein
MADETVQTFVDNFMIASTPSAASAAIGVSDIDEGVNATGTNHATGYSVTKNTTRFTTVTGVDYAASLVEASTITAGKKYIIYNDDTTDPLTVFPEASDNLGSLPAGVGVVIEPGWYMVVTALTDSAWKYEIGRPKFQSTYSANQTLSRREMFSGGLTIFSSAATGTLQAGEDGMEFVIYARAATSINPDGTEVIELNGTDLTGGNEIDISAGDLATFEWDQTNSKWIVFSATAVDGGA